MRIANKFKRNERYEQTVRFLLNAIVMIALTIYFHHVWHDYYRRFVYYEYRGNYFYIAVNLCFMILFNQIFGGFQLGTSTTGDLIFSQLLSLLFSNMIVFIQLMLVTYRILPARQLLSYIGVDVIIVVVCEVLFNKVYYNIFPPKKTILIYQEADPTIYRRIQKYQHNSYDIELQIPFEEYRKNTVILPDYQCVIGANLKPDQKEILLRDCYERGKQFYLIPDIYDVIVNSAKSVYLVDTPVFRTNNFGPGQLEKVVKRLWDIIFSSIFLCLTSPILLVTALAVKLQDGGPVFYKQVRLTQYGRQFEIIKFRSMRIDAEKDGVARLAAENDERITKVGKFIRKTRIDELPQLINILKGDMSVVGPRPERPEIAAEILKEVPEFNYRLGVKAGLTGYAQVYGKYNTKLRDKLLFDLIYIENFSILLDIRIMFLTFKIIFKKDSTEGVSEEQEKKE